MTTLDGLARAIAAADERDAKANGTWVEPGTVVEKIWYIAIYRVAGKPIKFRSDDPALFKRIIDELKEAYPNLPFTLFEITEKVKI